MSQALDQMGSHFVMVLRELAKAPESPIQVKKDWNTIERWILESGQTIPSSEPFVARAWQAYLQRGLAPSITLQPAFDHFRKAASASDYNLRYSQPPLEVSEVFDRMLATDDEISKKRTIDYFTPAENLKIQKSEKGSNKKSPGKKQFKRRRIFFDGLPEGWRRLSLILAASVFVVFVYQAVNLQFDLWTQGCSYSCASDKIAIAWRIAVAVLAPFAVNAFVQLFQWVVAGFKKEI